MKIIFLVPIVPLLLVAALLFTGHTGAAEKLIALIFFLLTLFIGWVLLRENIGVKK